MLFRSALSFSLSFAAYPDASNNDPPSPFDGLPRTPSTLHTAHISLRSLFRLLRPPSHSLSRRRHLMVCLTTFFSLTQRTLLAHTHHTLLFLVLLLLCVNPKPTSYAVPSLSSVNVKPTPYTLDPTSVPRSEQRISRVCRTFTLQSTQRTLPHADSIPIYLLSPLFLALPPLSLTVYRSCSCLIGHTFLNARRSTRWGGGSFELPQPRRDTAARACRPFRWVVGLRIES